MFSNRAHLDCRPLLVPIPLYLGSFGHILGVQLSLPRTPSVEKLEICKERPEKHDFANRTTQGTLTETKILDIKKMFFRWSKMQQDAINYADTFDKFGHVQCPQGQPTSFLQSLTIRGHK